MTRSRSPWTKLPLAGWLLLVACGGSQSPPPSGVVVLAPDTTQATAAPQVDPSATRSAIAALVSQRWTDIAAARFDQSGDALATDALEWGTGPNELMLSREASIANLHRLFDPVTQAGGHIEMRSQGADVRVAPDGHAAWFSDFPTFRVMVPGQPEQSGTLRVTGFAVPEEAGWRLTASHVSIGATTEQTATQAWPAIAPVPDGVAADAQNVAGMFRQAMTSIDALASQFAATGELIGTSPTEHLVGAEAIGQYLRQIAMLAGVSARITGGMRAGMAPGGETGWVAANVEVSGRGPRGPFTAPLRVLAIYGMENRVGRIVQMHWSHGIP